VTSGTFSPTLKKPIALAYLEGAGIGLGIGAGVSVEIRGSLAPAKIVAKNFIKR
jgi:glycine cleavage system aminomethyltransferase T